MSLFNKMNNSRKTRLKLKKKAKLRFKKWKYRLNNSITRVSS